MTQIKKNTNDKLETVFYKSKTELNKHEKIYTTVKKIDTRLLENPQIIDDDGKIQIPRWGWGIRITIVISLLAVFTHVIIQAVQLGDPFMIHSVSASVLSILVLVLAWNFYRNPANGELGNALVSVVIPIYNQASMIRLVIDSIYNSSYKNLEVIAVNDGSSDGTKEILDDISKKYPTLKIIHKKNEGKRKAVGTGFTNSKGTYIINIDSDSIIDTIAIEEFVKTFEKDKKIGSVVANVKTWNKKKNLLTKIQDVWYDISFNINKASESKFGLVLCCSGCMAGYRRDAVINYIPIWMKAHKITGDDRELTSLVISKANFRTDLLAAFAQKQLEYSSQFDDSEDRMLTAQSLVEWKSVYVASAVVYTDVPEKMKGFLKQQMRWKKGYLRGQFFVSTFFWLKNPVMAFIFYLEFMSTITIPLVLFTVLIYEPLVTGRYWFTAFFILSQTAVGFIEGLDSKLRNRKSTTWKFKPLMNLVTVFIVSWMVFPALWNLRKNEWGTR